MTATTVSANPFALMVQPEAVIQAMEGSVALRGLTQQQFRPLDREVPDTAASENASTERRANRAGGTPIDFVPTQFERDLVLPRRLSANRFSVAH